MTMAHDSYNFNMPNDIEQSFVRFSRECFNPDSPILAWAAEWHDLKEELALVGKSINDIVKIPRVKEAWDRNVTSIGDMISRHLSFMSEDKGFINDAASVLMIRAMSASTFTGDEMANLVRHSFRKYMNDNPIIMPVLESLSVSMPSRNWYRRAQEDEDMMEAVKAGLEAREMEPIIEAVSAEVSACGVAINSEDEAWIISKIRAAQAKNGAPGISSGNITKMALGIVFSKWIGKNNRDSIFNMSGEWEGNLLSVCNFLLKSGAIHDGLSLMDATHIYMSAIKPIEPGSYSNKHIAKLIEIEMKLKGLP
jgi:hypothetical protein